jgi:outer membrane protein OmpA-like peptidoglycan-associated protein
MLMKASYKELDLVVAVLRNNPTLNVRLSGHTDFIGTDDYNLTLSRNRARSVADYLISKGIKPERIQSFGFGKTRPLVSEKTDEARMVNRRVEVRFTAREPADKF